MIRAVSRVLARHAKSVHKLYVGIVSVMHISATFICDICGDILIDNTSPAGPTSDGQTETVRKPRADWGFAQVSHPRATYYFLPSSNLGLPSENCSPACKGVRPGLYPSSILEYATVRVGGGGG